MTGAWPPWPPPSRRSPSAIRSRSRRQGSVDSFSRQELFRALPVITPGFIFSFAIARSKARRLSFSIPLAVNHLSGGVASAKVLQTVDGAEETPPPPVGSSYLFGGRVVARPWRRRPVRRTADTPFPARRRIRWGTSATGQKLGGRFPPWRRSRSARPSGRTGLPPSSRQKRWRSRR